MQVHHFEYSGADGLAVFAYRWLPDDVEPRAIIQISHGLAEHAGRYARLAEALTAQGYGVYANDHRGHGRTAEVVTDLGHLADHDGWTKLVADVETLYRRIDAEWRGVPIVLLGHSMGSFAAQQFLYQHDGRLAGAVLSASNGAPPPIAWVGLQLARFERWRLGPRGRSTLLQRMAFGDFNRRFGQTRTEFDWLSRDTVEVDRYVADPQCGFSPTVQTWIDLLSALGPLSRPEMQARIPKHLPIWIIAGSEDPVSDNTRGLEQLLAAYGQAGLKRVEYKFYTGARHELFNETCRAEVVADLLAWLDAVSV